MFEKEWGCGMRQSKNMQREREREEGRGGVWVRVDIYTLNLAYNEIVGSDSVSSLNPRSRWIKDNF